MSNKMAMPTDPSYAGRLSGDWLPQDWETIKDCIDSVREGHYLYEDEQMLSGYGLWNHTEDCLDEERVTKLYRERT